MALINNLSDPVLRGEADIFTVPETDTTVESSFYAEYKPVVNIQDSDAKIEFRLAGNSSQYIDLYDSFLYITVRVVDGSGKNIPGGETISTTNNFFHSLFSQVDLNINNQIISSTNNCYAYKAYIETLLSNGYDAIHSQAQCAMFFKDTNGGSVDFHNKGFKERSKCIEGSKMVELIGKLRIDLSSQNRYILNDTNICISLTRNTDGFCILYPDPADISKHLNPRVKFLDASLFVRKQVLYPSISISHQKLLQSGLSAQYPLSVSDIKQFTIPAGNQSFIEENIFLGRVPSRIIIALVSNAAFNGDYKLNPFCFKHFDINYISITVNNMPIPVRGMNLDFRKGQYLLPYYLLLTSLGITSENEGIILDPAEYENGNVLFSFDLNHRAPSNSTLVLENTGSVRAELKFSVPLPQAVTCIVYSESQSILAIDKHRQVSVS